jgi:hypothetical protein
MTKLVKMVAKNKLHQKIPELTPKESLEYVKGLIKRKRKVVLKDLKPGRIFFTTYNAKHKEHTYDRTPLILILKKSPSYTLGINFHWLPISLRMNLVKHIMDKNAANIRQRKAFKFSYADFKPLLKSLRYAPCIRLYINRRFGKKGVTIPGYKLLEIARLRTETFTNGKYSASQLYAMARAAGKRKKK